MLVRASGFVAGPPGCSSSGRTSPGAVMSSIGTTTWSSSGLRVPASTIVTSRPGPTPPRKRAIVSSGRWVADRPIRCGGRRCRRRPRRPARSRCSSRSRRQREVGAALRAGDRVDLVDDHVLDAAEDLARLAREHQVERLGRRDEDVRRAAGDVPAVLGRRVAGAARDRDVGAGRAEAGGGEGDPGERRPEVALDVVGQRLERADVQDADACPVWPFVGGRSRRRRGQPVERPEERGEGLAAAGRGVDQRVAAAR